MLLSFSIYFRGVSVKDGRLKDRATRHSRSSPLPAKVQTEQTEHLAMLRTQKEGYVVLKTQREGNTVLRTQREGYTALRTESERCMAPRTEREGYTWPWQRRVHSARQRPWSRMAAFKVDGKSEIEQIKVGNDSKLLHLKHFPGCCWALEECWETMTYCCSVIRHVLSILIFGGCLKIGW